MIEELLKNKTARERAGIKAREIVSRTTVKNFSSRGFDIEIISVGEIPGGVEVMAKAFKNGKSVGLGYKGKVETERFRIFNPPVLVDDENGDITREFIDEKGKLHRRILKEDPEEALKQSLGHTIQITHKDIEPLRGIVGNTTSTFYPDANVESTSVDGYTGFDDVASTNDWTALRAETGNISSESGTLLQLHVIATATTDEWRRLYRVIVLFDTSAITDTDEISSAVLSLNGDSAGTGAGITANITSSAPASNTAIANSDYATASFGSVKFATGIAEGSIAVGSYNDFTLNASGLANISKTGVSKFALRCEEDIDNVSPTWGSGVESALDFDSADTAGTTSDPKLVVVHSALSTFTPKAIMF